MLSRAAFFSGSSLSEPFPPPVLVPADNNHSPVPRNCRVLLREFLEDLLAQVIKKRRSLRGQYPPLGRLLHERRTLELFQDLPVGGAPGVSLLLGVVRHGLAPAVCCLELGETEWTAEVELSQQRCRADVPPVGLLWRSLRVRARLRVMGPLRDLQLRELLHPLGQSYDELARRDVVCVYHDYSCANFLSFGAVCLSKALLSDDLPINVAALQARETKHLVTPTRKADPGVDPGHD